MSKSAAMDERTRHVTEEAEVLPLEREDQTRFAEMLIAPLKPNERLRRAATDHANLVGR